MKFMLGSILIFQPNDDINSKTKVYLYNNKFLNLQPKIDVGRFKSKVRLPPSQNMFLK